MALFHLIFILLVTTITDTTADPGPNACVSRGCQFCHPFMTETQFFALGKVCGTCVTVVNGDSRFTNINATCRDKCFANPEFTACCKAIVGKYQCPENACWQPATCPTENVVILGLDAYTKAATIDQDPNRTLVINIRRKFMFHLKESKKYAQKYAKYWNAPQNRNNAPQNSGKGHSVGNYRQRPTRGRPGSG